MSKLIATLENVESKANPRRLHFPSAAAISQQGLLCDKNKEMQRDTFQSQAANLTPI